MFDFLKKRKLKKMLDQAQIDGRISDSELARAAEYAERKGLPLAFIGDEIIRRFNDRCKEVVSVAYQARRLADRDFDFLLNAAEDLRVPLHLCLTRDLMNFRNMSRIERGDLPLDMIHEHVSFQKRDSEVVFCVKEAVWQEMRRVRTRVGYQGFSTNIRIFQGFSYRMGTVRPVYEESDQLKEISSGDLAVTIERVVFNGDRRS